MMICKNDSADRPRVPFIALLVRRTTVFSMVVVSFLCSASSSVDAQTSAVPNDAPTGEASPLPASLSRAGIERLKQATAYIKVRRGGQAATGSGFMLQQLGDAGFIVTNSHVVTLESGFAETVTVVFHAGTSREKEIAATIVANNPGSDLAMLRVEGADLPPPLPAGNPVDLYETLPVYIAGFPFGESLASQDGNPNITVSRGTVSSIRRNNFDQVSTVQIDGSINPGNSGGPIVATDGRLVGIAVATLTGTQIGMAIPQRDLQAMLRGETGPLVVSRGNTPAKRSRINCITTLVDPMSRIKEASIHVVTAKSAGDPRPNKEGRWGPIQSEMESVRVPVNPKSNRLAFEIAIPEGNAGSSEFYLQVSLTSNDGETIWQQPGKIRFSPGSEAAIVYRGQVAYLKPTKEEERVTSRPPAMRRDKPATSDDPTIRMAIDRKLVPAICWTPGGEEILTLSTDGVLTKYSVSTGSKLAEVEIDSQCSDLDLSKEGIVAVLSGLGEIRVLDTDSMELVSTARVPGAESIACSPNSSRGYVLTGPSSITVVDLKGGRTADLEIQQSHQMQRPLRLKPHDLVLTPDGKYLFAEGGIEMLVRMAVGGRSITIEEATPRIISGRRSRIVVSADSRLVAVPSGGGNSKAEKHPKVNYGTYIYEVNNLSSPRLAVSTGAYPQAIAFDVKANLIYAQNRETALMVLSAGGSVKSKFKLDGRADSRVIVPHPDGFAACVLTESQLVYFDLSEFRK